MTRLLCNLYKILLPFFGHCLGVLSVNVKWLQKSLVFLLKINNNNNSLIQFFFWWRDSSFFFIMKSGDLILRVLLSLVQLK